MKTNMKNMKLNKFIAVLSAALLVLSLASIPVNAAAPITEKGSLTIITEYDGNPLQGMEIEIYRIAIANFENGKIIFTPAANFSGTLSGVNIDPYEMTAGENAVLAGALKTYASGQRITATKGGATNAKGEIEFPDLESGLYLVTQKESTNVNTNNGRYNMQSFILPVPYTDDYGIGFSVVGVVFTHPKIEPKKGSLTLTKTVTGSGAPANTDFWFTVKFTYPDGVTLNGTKISGEVSVSLKAGTTAKFENIPLGTEYEITEVNIPARFTFVSLTNSKGTVANLTPVTLTAINNYDSTTTTTTLEPPTTTYPPPTTTTPPPTTTTGPPSTTQPPVTTTQPPITTQPPVTTIPPPITTATTLPPTTPPPTQPTIETTTDDEYEIVTEPTLPLTNITFPGNTTTDEEEEFDNTVPLASITFPGDNRPPPKTGDTYTVLAVLFGVLLLSGSIAIFIIKKKKEEKNNI